MEVKYILIYVNADKKDAVSLHGRNPKLRFLGSSGNLINQSCIDVGLMGF